MKPLIHGTSAFEVTYHEWLQSIKCKLKSQLCRERERETKGGRNNLQKRRKTRNRNKLLVFEETICRVSNQNIYKLPIQGKVNECGKYQEMVIASDFRYRWQNTIPQSKWYILKAKTSMVCTGWWQMLPWTRWGITE